MSFSILIISSLIYMVTKNIKANGAPISGSVFFFLQLIFNVGIMLYETVLVVPFSQFMLNGFFCKSTPFSQNYDCGSLKAVRIIISVVAMILHILVVIYVGIFFCDLNPFSSGPLSSTQTYYNKILLGSKVIIPALFLFSFEHGYIMTVLFFKLGLHFILYVLLLTRPPLPDRPMSYLRLLFQNFLMWTTLAVII